MSTNVPGGKLALAEVFKEGIPSLGDKHVP